MKVKTGILLAAALASASGTLCAQDFSQDFPKITNFSIDGVKIQMHGFASQDFVLSNDNNYMTMNRRGRNGRCSRLWKRNRNA